jgi:hypothetical protein
MAEPGVSAAQICAALRAHYIAPNEPYPGGVFMTEVPLPTPDQAVSHRRADAVYVALTRSQGLGIDVCEIKVSRTDLMRELDKPVKAEAWWPHSSRWWIVSPAPEITPPDLLPDGWGLMCPSNRGRRFKVWKTPQVRQPQVSLPLLIEIVKKLDTARVEGAHQARDEARHEAREQIAKVRTEKVNAEMTERQRERLALLDQMETAAGIEFDTHGNLAWSDADSSYRRATPDQWAQALRAGFQLVATAEQVRGAVEQTQFSLDRIAARAREGAKELAASLAVLAGVGTQDPPVGGQP